MGRQCMPGWKEALWRSIRAFWLFRVECGWRHLGRLTLDGAYIPMEMRTIFPVHPELNQLSQVMQIDFDELLAGYMDPSGRPLLRQWLS